MMTKANTKYKTVKRRANVGERILITNANTSMGFYGNGDVLTVESLYNVISSGVRAKETRQDCPFIRHDEYEVIIEESPSDTERITVLESQVAELQAELQTLKKRKKPKHLLTHYPTPNEQRKAVIERAKAFVTDNVAPGTQRLNFYVNAEKRTVVTVITWAPTGFVKQRGIAKCAPDDVFNADIGKAIALGRALGLDVSEFVNAPKPTEVVVGMVVSYFWKYKDALSFNHAVKDSKEVHVVNNDLNERDAVYYVEILNDTEAQY